jgi:hypothetical protein
VVGVEVESFAQVELVCALALHAGVEVQDVAAAVDGGLAQPRKQRLAVALRAFRLGGDEVVHVQVLAAEQVGGDPVTRDRDHAAAVADTGEP